MKKIIWILVVTMAFTACNKAKELRYDSHDNIYLDLRGSDRDSLLYTFAFEPAKASDTVWLPIRISGIRQETDRKFVLKVLTDSSTAKPAIHYKPLDDFYTIPKNTGETMVPVIMYNTDPELENRSVSMRFQLVATPDFGINIPGLIDGKLVFSNKLERPSWWGMWFGGYYSRAKHQFFLITSGITTLSTEGLDAPKNLYFVGLVTSFLDDPAKWISKNAAKGYVLSPRADGNFEFYNIATPAKKILFRKNVAANKYFFVDENGEEVI